MGSCDATGDVQYTHGSRGRRDDGDVFSLHGDGPGDVELGGQLPHHHIPEEAEKTCGHVTRSALDDPPRGTKRYHRQDRSGLTVSMLTAVSSHADDAFQTFSQKTEVCFVFCLLNLLIHLV